MITLTIAIEEKDGTMNVLFTGNGNATRMEKAIGSEIRAAVGNVMLAFGQAGDIEKFAYTSTSPEANAGERVIDDTLKRPEPPPIGAAPRR